MERILVYFGLAMLAIIALVFILVGRSSAQKPLDRWRIRSYSDGASGLTMHVVEDQSGEGCWLFAESSRGLAIASADLGVCHDTERE